ncbi:Major facilitator superfamily domain-containing protein 4A [Halotydeus destructor]|nr:Major facilitator superfamily domain-containing protein 4A [Halotydeus destructor]
MILSIIGPTILELQCLLDVDYLDVISIIPARAAGFAFGALLVGVFHKQLNPISTTMAALTIIGICVTLLPWAASLHVALILAFIGYSGGGVISSTSNMFLMSMWGTESQPYMQALQFCFGFGSLVTPLLVSPFLSTIELPVDVLSASTAQEPGIVCSLENVKIRIPYAIIGTLALLTAMVFAFLHCFYRETDEHPSRLDKKVKVGGASHPGCKKKAVLVLTGFFLFSFMGIEIGMGSFTSSFAVKSDNRLSTQVGAYMTSLYWFTYTCFPLVLIIFINKISISLIITLELCILVVANIFLVPFGNTVECALWVGLALMGIALSMLWASTFSLLESYFPVTSGAASFLALSVCLGEWVYPLIMGHAMEASPQLYLWTISACTALLWILFGTLLLALETFFGSQDSLSLEKSLLETPATYGSVEEQLAENHKAKAHVGILALYSEFIDFPTENIPNIRFR